MPALDIHILRLDDPAIWSDLATKDPADVIHVPDVRIQAAVIERGMQSGKSSVALRIDLLNGKTIIAETSLALLATVIIAARGAFPGDFAGGPLDPGPQQDVSGN